MILPIHAAYISAVQLIAPQPILSFFLRGTTESPKNFSRIQSVFFSVGYGKNILINTNMYAPIFIIMSDRIYNETHHKAFQ